MSALDDRRALPIGVFDSGVGGLTVLRALQRHLPNERYLYLGDTARLPYGTKSADTIVQYSLQAADLLVRRGIKCMVIACNTASATALEALRQRYMDLPIIGVVQPGAQAGCRASVNGRIAVVATEGTVQGGAYQRAIAALRPEAVVVAKACPLFVSLAEEGWVSGSIVEAIAQRYLGDIFADAASPDTLLLGCTHFPVIRAVLQRVVGSGVTIVDSAETTAVALSALLDTQNLLRAEQLVTATPMAQFLATDGCERFARVAAYFLERQIAATAVELIDIGLGERRVCG
ncbi:MAG: glutamate racemase [Steroidobacteraceae bacterium]